MRLPDRLVRSGEAGLRQMKRSAEVLDRIGMGVEPRGACAGQQAITEGLLRYAGALPVLCQRSRNILRRCVGSFQRLGRLFVQPCALIGGDLIVDRVTELVVAEAIQFATMLPDEQDA